MIITLHYPIKISHPINSHITINKAVNQDFMPQQWTKAFRVSSRHLLLYNFCYILSYKDSQVTFGYNHHLWLSAMVMCSNQTILLKIPILLIAIPSGLY